MIGFSLRPFTGTDYAGITAVINAADSEFAFTITELQCRDERRQAGMRFARWVAVEPNGRIVGVTEYDQRPDKYHPLKWQVRAYVHPEGQG